MDEAHALRISKALADGKRFEMLRRIANSRNAPTCSCIKDWVGLSPATVTHHLQELENAGLIHGEKAGKYTYITFRRDTWDSYRRHLSEV